MSGDATLVLLKPDARQRNLVGTILHRIEEHGLHLDMIQTVHPTEKLLADHYQEHTEKDFYPGLEQYMLEDPGVVAVKITGTDAVQLMRDLAGDTEPVSADEGTIRGDLGTDSYDQADAEDRGLRNLVHASELGDAQRELQLWFSKTV